MFGTAYGLEHVPERLAFLSFLREANEEDENAYPVNYCVKLYEESSMQSGARPFGRAGASFVRNSARRILALRISS